MDGTEKTIVCVDRGREHLEGEDGGGEGGGKIVLDSTFCNE